MALRVDDLRGGSEWVGGRVILRQRSASAHSKKISIGNTQWKWAVRPIWQAGYFVDRAVESGSTVRPEIRRGHFGALQRSVSMDKRQTVANGRSNGVAKCQQYIVG